MDRSGKKIYERIQRCGEEARDSEGCGNARGRERIKAKLRSLARCKVPEGESARDRVKKSIQERKRRCEDRVERGGVVSKTR